MNLRCLFGHDRQLEHSVSTETELAYVCQRKGCCSVHMKLRLCKICGDFVPRSQSDHHYIAHRLAGHILEAA